MIQSITHVIPDEWGPFVDINACYQSFERRSIRTRVLAPGQFNVAWPSCGSDGLFILWSPEDPGPRDRRDCYVAAVYSEAFDADRSKLLPDHRTYFEYFCFLSQNLDGVFVHTPWMQEQLKPWMHCPVYVMPVGWDAEAMGCPRWDTPKHTKIGYRGSRVGRRLELVQPFMNQFVKPNDFAIMSGRFGRVLLGHLDQTAVDLYIAHSSVRSFSTWRLWQAASTSCVLVAEPGDTWPFIAGKHFVEISSIEIATVPAAARVVLDLARNAERTREGDGYLVEYARAAHELARTFTLERIENEFVVPAFENMQRRS